MLISTRCMLVLLFALALVCQPVRAAEQEPIIDLRSIFQPVVGRSGMVASQEALASEVGLEILRQGGNAVDAAVATGFALAVTLPKAGNIGGGGFMLVYLADKGESIAIDYREMAPRKAHRDMFLDANGDVDKNLSRYSRHAAGVPGTVHGLLSALEKYGTMNREQVMAPAIRLAEEGYPISHAFARELRKRRKQLSRSEAGEAIFFKANGDNFEAGELLVQKDLARSLKQVAKGGIDAFYRGDIAQLFERDSRANGGLIDREDMAAYRSVERPVVRGEYRGYEIVSMPPPSSGGVHVVQMLNVLEQYDLKAMGHNSADYLHLLTETMKRAYADRSEYLGDPDFADVPIKALTADSYAKRIAAAIDPQKATPSTDIKPGLDAPAESHDTTHFSVVDRWGNAVANTYTLNFSYGSGIVVAGTGILLNNEMDDFSSKPGTPNAFGLLGGEANAIAAGKRPLSSMTPTIVLEDGKPRLVVGSPGGSRIITVVLQMILNVIDHGMNVAEAMSVPRVHHQWFPDKLFIEKGISADTRKILEAKGQTVADSRVLGSVQAIEVIDGLIYGKSDPRRPGAMTVAY